MAGKWRRRRRNMIEVPAVLYDGESEFPLGDAFLFDSVDVKSFQSIIGARVGVSPSQLLIYLAEREGPTRIALTPRTDFSAVSRGKSWVLLVVLRRPRRRGVRRQRPVSRGKLIQPETASLFNSNRRLENFDNVKLLRRDSSANAGLVSDCFRFENQVREIEGREEKYLMNVTLGSDHNSGPNSILDGGMFLNLGFDFGSSRSGRKADRQNNSLECDQCEKAKINGVNEPEFHHCVYDSVCFEFKLSIFGPIRRPN